MKLQNLRIKNLRDNKLSGNPYNEADICIAIYNPLKHKVKVYREYKIIVNTTDPNSFQGMRDRFRSAIIIKNRYGICDRVVELNFFGELGVFYELPKLQGNEIVNYDAYMTLEQKDKKQKDVEQTIVQSNMYKF